MYMKYRVLGKTGLKVSELSFGAGGFWGMKSFDEKRAEQLVNIAIENGITLFDTGPNYSNANAEVRLGRILKGRAKSVIVGTKVGTQYMNGKHVKDFSPQAIEQSILQSLKNLQTDYIPLIHFHGFPIPTDDAIEKLLKLKEKGIIGHIGVSTDGDDAKKAVELGVFESLMIQYNIIERATPAKIIEDANKKDMGVLIKSPLAQTLYSNDIFKIKKASDVWYLLRALKNHRKKFLKGRKLRFVNDVEGLSGSDVALNFVLNNENLTSAVIGTVNPKHLISNIESLNYKLPKEIIKKVESIY
jgi:1-deoxyxylulose-5-phosphate synthase